MKMDVLIPETGWGDGNFPKGMAIFPAVQKDSDFLLCVVSGNDWAEYGESLPDENNF